MQTVNQHTLSGIAAAAALTAAACAASPQLQKAIPAELSIAAVEQGLVGHAFTVRALADHYAQRIATIDRGKTELRSVIEVNPDAGTLAAELDRQSAPQPNQILFGVPVLIKDNIDTADAMLTTAGSLALTGSKPQRDAFIVTRLRAAGALLLGKTNLSEWANFRSTHSSSGWSGRGGQTRNPYALNRDPCGSSSGSGAAIAADLAVVAIGTETDGSIVCPSSMNGLVGIKPTVGLVSRSGIIPISASQDTAGPMTRTVADAAAILTVIAGYDPNDPATAALRSNPPPDYRKFLNRDGLRGVRLGVVRQHAGFNEEVDQVFARALDTLKAQGAEIVDPVDLPTHDKFNADEQTVLLYEFKDGINRYLAGRSGGPRTLADLITFNTNERAREMPNFGQELFISSQAKGPLTDKEYVEAHERARRLAGREGIDAALAKDHLDALIAPTVGPAWTIDWVNGDHFTGGSASGAPAVAGYPHITVPMGLVRGLPVGLSLIGSAWSEPKLLTYAYAYEQASNARQKPEFVPVVQ